MAGAEVYRLFPSSISRERREPPAIGRLRTALAACDVETHRALARGPSMANLCELTDVQSTTLALTRVLMNAAVARDVVDQAPARAHVEPRLAAAQCAWGELHGTLRQLTRHAHRAVSRDLRLAGSELVLAFSELVPDGTAVADPATIVSRVDLGHTVSVLAGAMDAPHQASLLLLDAALDPRSRIDANAAQHLISQLTDAAGEVASAEDCWIDPRDLASSSQANMFDQSGLAHLLPTNLKYQTTVRLRGNVEVTDVAQDGVGRVRVDFTVTPGESFAIVTNGELCSHFIDGTPTLNAYFRAKQVGCTGTHKRARVTDGIMGFKNGFLGAQGSVGLSGRW